jgi:hypothetical protein
MQAASVNQKEECMTAPYHLALAVLLVLFSVPALAQESHYTDLVGKPCRFLKNDPRPGDVKLCKGVRSILPETVAEHTRTQFAFRFGSERPAPLVAAWSFGTKLEWRGIREAAGFEPYAAILRVLLKDSDSAKPTADGQVLALLRVDPGTRQACLAAVLDAVAPNANAAARGATDRMRLGFRCRADRPSTLGVATRWTRAVLAGMP